MKKPLFLLLPLLTLQFCSRPQQETTPIRKDVQELVFAAGALEANHSYSLTAQADGYLKSVNFEEGDLVKEGQLVALVDNQENGFNAESAEALFQIARKNTQPDAPGMQQAKIQATLAKSKMDQDARQEERYRRLRETKSVSESEYETVAFAAQSSKTSYENAVQTLKKLETEANQALISNKALKEVNALSLGKNAIRSVVAGRVYEKLKQAGDYVKRGEVIAKIGDPNFLYARVHIDETSISKVKIGQKARVKLNSVPSKEYAAEVWEILPAFDEASQSYICKLRFLDSLDFRIIKTQLESNIEIGTNQNALLIPRNYLEFGGFVRVKGRDEKVKVETQFISSEWVQIKSGISHKDVLLTYNLNAQ